MTSHMIKEVTERIERVLGKEGAAALIATSCTELGIEQLKTSDDVARLGDLLIASGGLHEAIGRAIKVKAILSGASGAKHRS